ncbi:MAG TPA: MaoC family dehydratase N-terminal domain-containing protein [Pseudonocardiaceae bacterium]|jgi:acyl dehydratase|nr:MaoC family dehydratase N-terminal domain-containing protein [Pseudonocardiaceae bacterium]
MEDLIGVEVDRVGFDVERGKILEFARATHAQDPAHRDPAAEGGTGVLATATHVVVAGQHRDQEKFTAALGLDRTRVVVGSVDWHYARPLRAGDTLTGIRRVVADETREGRRGGRMRLVTLETEFTDQDGEIAVRQREVLIERGQA